MNKTKNGSVISIIVLKSISVSENQVRWEGHIFLPSLFPLPFPVYPLSVSLNYLLLQVLINHLLIY